MLQEVELFPRSLLPVPADELSVLAIDHYRRRLASSILRAWRKEAVDSIKIRMCQHQSDQSLLQQTFTGWVTVVQDRARRRLQLQVSSYLCCRCLDLGHGKLFIILPLPGCGALPPP